MSSFTYKCKYCNYVLPKFRRLRDGRFKDNYNRLVDHTIGCHLDEYSLLMEWLDYSCPSPATSTHPADIISECLQF